MSFISYCTGTWCPKRDKSLSFIRATLINFAMLTRTSFLLILIFFLPFVICQTPMELMVVIEEADSSILSILNDAVPEAERNFANDMITVHVSTVTVNRENVDASFEKVCAVLYKGISIILDMTWTGWDKLRNVADERGIIYKRGDCSISPYVQAIDDLLIMKNATDVGLIFEDERELNQSLYYLIGNSIIRLVVIDELTERTVTKVRSMRPSPSYYAIYASTAKMEELFKTAIGGGLVRRDGIWNLVFTDNNFHEFRYITGDLQLNVSFTILSMKTDICCRLMGDVTCSCPSNFKIFPYYFKRLIGLIVSLMSDVQRSGISVAPKTGQCDKPVSPTSVSNITAETFNKILMTRLDSNDTFEYWSEKAMITYKAEIELQVVNRGYVDVLATWTRRTKIKEADGRKIEPARRFFRIGTAPAVPWSVTKKDPVTGLEIRNEDGKEIWEGYCIDFVQKLSDEMQFDYDLIIPEDQEFGKKLPNGEWTGLIGDLARGETDIAVAALTMTSEREEVIDFVAPYFEQSGILIVMRKPVRKTSLFKFMTVLRLEVWLSIVGALTLTGVMIWILDKYSPYSARNNKRLYPYPCREFTLKESFWFALTSFTPQGGGEAPKALSSRTLVAAYWLFVVLMLATFTANLAAFLTVERMQSPVQSLEQLARQSRINYTVLANSSAHQYFRNMKNAEDKLYTVWKEITLNSTSDQVEYRVWDYPIKEQYGHILQAITQVGPVKTTEEGFKKVIESENAEFAFIHDSSEIKYEVTKNCNLTEVGDVFAEQPYAIAVQQGSHLQEEISRKILDLQKDRYFETLAAKYWNQTLKSQCPNSDDNEGITLESLGGVFIATLFGLALAMITLAGEVLYYRKRGVSQKGKPNDKKTIKDIENDKIIMQKIASKLRMKPAPTDAVFGKQFSQPPRVSHISVYPRHFPKE
ncbi:LOW QUALITY PROTEIN: glutamate receptor 4 [Solenopsis invicta]|uniref:LOW QUALITY PROTEIN: glutamate receptor 4 n=1 Tax=Solenopsis invicta TaxID=13686 RepID=UPI00193D96A7|nr:LOW QUALITY PROTEIN: glutamate receptor 4 [Solenopsis invicta]